MRITARLAYNQIKINRQRTIWTLLGIILSTALITAVCSFVASGNNLLVGIYGKNYTDQGGMGIVLLLIPASILSLIIASMAIVVISNAFRISASERRSQFGILKSVGTTKQQIIATVMYECMFFSVMGIPIGIVVGLILAFFSTQVANHFLSDINSLVNVMITELIFVFDFVISWQALLAAAAISFIMVLVSAWIPARKAARVTAIDSIRRVDEVNVSAKKMHTSYLIEKIFGYEGTLAAKNIKRSKRNLRASIISLTIGIVLFVCLGFLSEQIGEITKHVYSFGNKDVMVDYTSGYKSVINEETGREESVIIAPIDSKNAEHITEKLREYKEVAVLGTGMDMLTYISVVPDKMITDEMKKAIFSEDTVSTYELETEIDTVDSLNYKLLCEKAGVPVGSNILINRYAHNDKGNERIIQPFHFNKQNLKLMKADGTISELKIHGQLTPEQVPDDLVGANEGTVRLIVPEAEVRSYSWEVDTDDVEGFMKFANKIMGEEFPEDEGSGYMEQGFSTRVYKMRDYMKVMNLMINLIMAFGQSFVILLSLIGLTNVISTMSANVQMRFREFAVLQSIGMTIEGVKRMIVFESVICSGKSLFIGLPLAIVLTYFIHIPVRTMLPIPYEFPLGIVLGCAAAVFGVTTGTMWMSARKLQGKNIVETIRMDA